MSFDIDKALDAINSPVLRNPKKSRQHVETSTFREGRRRAALEMLRGGADIATIWPQLGYPSEKVCQMDVDRILLKIARIPYEEAKAIELARLDGLILAHWPAARRGDMQATDRVLKIIDARSKILGLNAPIRSEVVSMDAVESEIRRLEREMSRPQE